MIQGEIYTFPLLDIIQWVALTERTGELTVEHSPNRLAIFFSAGKIAATAFDLTDSDSANSIRVMLTEAVRWRWGQFEFRDSKLPQKVASTNLNLPVEFLLLDIIGVSQPTEASNDEERSEPTLSNWMEVNAPNTTLTLADTLRLKVADRLLREDFKVPPMPEVTAKLLKLTRDENFSMDELTDTVVTDPAIVAMIMRYANSALHNYEQEVKTLPSAVQRLGTDQVVNISLAASLGARQPGRDIFAANRKSLWTHSLVTAAFAGSVANRAGGLDGNLAFLCGLLMDFGMSVLYTLIQDVLGHGAVRDPALEESAAEIVKVYHQGVGRSVGSNWRLPEAVVESMANHHNLEVAATEREYVAIAALSDTLATYSLNRPRAELEEALTKIRPEDLAAHPAARFVNLQPKSAAKILNDIPKLLDQSLQLLAD